MFKGCPSGNDPFFSALENRRLRPFTFLTYQTLEQSLAKDHSSVPAEYAELWKY
jgi:hypothetical protein